MSGVRFVLLVLAGAVIGLGFQVAATGVDAIERAPADALQWALSGAAAVVLVAAWRMLTNAVWTVAAVVFAIAVVNIQIELLFFMKADAAQRLAMLAGQSANCLLVVLAGVLLASPREAVSETVSAWGGRGAGGWALRLVAAALVYVVLYFVVGASAYTYAKPYYDAMAGGLGLTVPDVQTVLATQVLRGSVYAAAALAYCLVTARRAGAAHVLALLLAGFGGLIPLLGNTAWPTELRLIHAIEIVLQNAPFGLAAYALFRTRPAAA